MIYSEDNPESQEGLSGEPSPAEFINKMVDKLGKLHQKDKEHQSSTVFIYAPGSQYVEKQYIFGKEPHPPTPLQRARGEENSEKTNSLPNELRTEEAMVLWRKAREAGYVDENFQPTMSRTLSAILAFEMAVRLDITEKWKTFEEAWNRRNMYRDYYKALNMQQTLAFQDEIKRIFR